MTSADDDQLIDMLCELENQIKAAQQMIKNVERDRDAIFTFVCRARREPAREGEGGLVSKSPGLSPVPGLAFTSLGTVELLASLQSQVVYGSKFVLGTNLKCLTSKAISLVESIGWH
jgi:hypothetical protein